MAPGSEPKVPDNSPSALIHLKNIQSNFELVRSLVPDSRIMVVVKANAYGHGSVEVCDQLKQADAFAVARVSEGLQLRESGITHPVVVLEGFLDKHDHDRCRKHTLMPVIHGEYQLALLDPDLPAWLKLNSGMFRLGFNVDRLKLLSSRIRQKNIVGLMSHLADANDQESNQKQIELFNHGISELQLSVDRSLANSGGIMGLTETHMEWVRPGIMMYGGSPDCQVDERLKPGMTLTAPVLAVNEMGKGDSIGYGGTWTADKSSRVAVVGLGYADGYPRQMPEGTPVLVNQRRRHLVGRISMDMCFVLLEEFDKTSPGDRVTFWGENLPIDEVAAWGNTIGYTLMSGLTSRVNKIYAI